MINDKHPHLIAVYFSTEDKEAHITLTVVYVNYLLSKRSSIIYQFFYNKAILFI